MHDLEVADKADKALRKLKKRDPEASQAVRNKLGQILEDPYRFKPLRGDMRGTRRVHLGSFVLVYEIEGTIVRVLDYDHHDNVYEM